MHDLEIESRFNSILEEHGRLLRNAIAAHCPKTLGLDLDDIVQEARLRLWRAISSEKEIRDLASYLFRIAANVTIDAVRRVKARREEQMEFSANPNAGPGEPQQRPQLVDRRASAETIVERRRLVEVVNEALAQLAANRGWAVRLHLQGLTISEISVVMGWSEAKSRNLVYRGLGDLREQLRVRGVDCEIE
jgi:RNA polymerase sigma-70 factor (ECF subfamily)